MLARASFGNNSCFTHPLGQKDLAHTIIDFVSARMEQVFPFEINLCASEFAGEAFGKVKRRWSSAKLFQIIVKFALKLGIFLGTKILLLELLQGMHQGFRNETPSVRAEMAMVVGRLLGGDSTH